MAFFVVLYWVKLEGLFLVMSWHLSGWNSFREAST